MKVSQDIVNQKWSKYMDLLNQNTKTKQILTEYEA